MLEKILSNALFQDICTALINIASAALDRDLRAEGRTPESLGIENIKSILRDSGKAGILFSA